jgi:hypothetical protein
VQQLFIIWLGAPVVVVIFELIILSLGEERADV